MDRVGLLIVYLKNTQRWQGLHNHRLLAEVPAWKRHRAGYRLSYPPSVRGLSEGLWEDQQGCSDKGPWQVGGEHSVLFPCTEYKSPLPTDFCQSLATCFWNWGSFHSSVDCLPCVVMGIWKSGLKLFKKFLCSTQEPIMRLSST